MQKKNIYNRREAAEYLSISERTVRRMCASGDFPAPSHVSGQRSFWTEKDLDTVVELVTARAKHASFYHKLSSKQDT